MPMKTTLETRSRGGAGGWSPLEPAETRPGPPGTSPAASSRAPATTWATISAVDRLRVRPAWPVAQNGHAIPQPACDETHIVTRSGYRMSTDSTSDPSKARHSVLRVVPPSQTISRSAVSSRGSRAWASASRDARGRSLISSGWSV
jgi:hypothetical protein